MRSCSGVTNAAWSSPFIRRAEYSRDHRFRFRCSSQPPADAPRIRLIRSAEPPPEIALLWKDQEQLDDHQRWYEQYDGPPCGQQQSTSDREKRQTDIHG